MKYLDLTGLSSFWTKAKEWITTQISEAISTLKSGLKLQDISDVTATSQEVNYLTGLKSNAQGQLDALAPKESPQFSGTPTAPTPESSDKSTKIATTQFVADAILAGVDGAMPDFSSYFNAPPVYNSESKKIEFYHDTTKVAELDATAFIKDGMVNTVTISDGKTDGDNNGKKVLLITFNTDAGREDIEIPIESIFDATNYYTKAQVDDELAKKANASQLEWLGEEQPVNEMQFTHTDEYIEVEIKRVNLETGKVSNSWINAGLIKPVDQNNVGLMTPADKASLDDLKTNAATKTDLSKKLDTLTYDTDKVTFETKENAASTYQPKGEYALKSELPDDYLTETDLEGYIKVADLVAISTQEIDSLFS